MKPWVFALLGLFPFPLAAQANGSLADVLADPGVDLSDPVSRELTVARMRVLSEQRRLNAREQATRRGLPLRVSRPNGTDQEIADFEGGEPVYLTTHNANAAISTGANLVRSAYPATGSGVIIGMWDSGSGRTTHQEFSNRMLSRDGASSSDHATHVGGTLAASGVVSSARGMAPAAVVHSYDWNNDLVEMTSRGATGPNQADKIYISNHSYGYISGWTEAYSSTRVWEWYGTGTTASSVEQDFGRYQSLSRDEDALAYNAPYYLIFRSAGNERNDNPTAGERVALSPGSSTVVNYNPAVHPGGDGMYRGGFDNIGFAAVAKNIVTVGSVSDAVTGTSRDPGRADSSDFSSWGPTDDGRIKPDIVANGESVYSPVSGSNTSYGNYSGTSMSSPNAAGSAALLVHHYRTLFPGKDMRASTLKGLLIHTADDLGNPGPDYKFGWGLINTKAAADLIADHRAIPDKQRITESDISASTGSRIHTFLWDGVSPLRATLSWTDPAGTATSTSDLRTPRLINNLDVKIIAPNGTEFLPFVMPFVGNWSQSSMDSAAVTGVNRTDNVEQVLLQNPPAAGTYQAVVSYSGTLANGSQAYSLLLSGTSGEPPPPLPLRVSRATPSSGSAAPISISLAGTGFRPTTAVKLTRTDHPDIVASSVKLEAGALICQFNLTGASTGKWNIVSSHQDESHTLDSGFTVVGGLWTENFDGAIEGWSTVSVRGTSKWAVTDKASHSPSNSFFSAGPAPRTTTALVTPVISLPANASNLQVRFWHQYDLQASMDGGHMEFSIEGGDWFDVQSQASGLAFASNGYNGKINKTTSDIANRNAWTSKSNGFIQTVVNFLNSPKFAGRDIRIRWTLATNGSVASPGWHIDSIALVGGGDLINQPPLMVNQANTSSTEKVTGADSEIYHVVRGAAVDLSALASDDAGEPLLTYTWAVTNGPEVPVFFSENGTNEAKSTTAHFETTGDYEVTVAVSDEQESTTSSSVNVRVVQTASAIGIDPAAVSLAVGSSQGFQAVVMDQFEIPMGTQPAEFIWSASGGGTITPAGVFTAEAAGGPHVVSASTGSMSNIATITITPAQADVSLGNLQQIYNGLPRVVDAVTDPVGLAVEVTYDGSTTAPTHAGSYLVEANIIDPDRQGSATGTLVVGKASAAITFSQLSHSFDGSPKAASVTTDPPGLAFTVTYDGLPAAPSAHGNYALIATITDANHEGSAAAQLTISGSSYSTWKSARFSSAQITAGDGDADADPDRDGLKNLAEYALGKNPLSFDPSPAAVITDGLLTLTFDRPKGLSGVSYHAESTRDLLTWSEAILEVISETPETETLRATATPLPGSGILFLRLRFED